RLVTKFEPGRACGRDETRRAHQGEPDEGDGNPVKALDLVGRKQRLAAVLHHGGRREIVEFRAGEGVRSEAIVDGMAAAVLHPQQLVLALVEFMVADGSDLE